jgi:DNA polymerase III alpha subunit (gram-positive type)
VKPTVYFDLETGGLDVESPIIQLAEALEINHYDRQRWLKEGMPPQIAFERFSKFLNQFKSIPMISKRTGRTYQVARLAGYNCLTFDAPRLQYHFKQHDLFLPAHPATLDVLALAMWRLSATLHFETPSASTKLGFLCEAFGVPLDNAHDALADVRGTIALAKRLTQEAVVA